MSLVPVLAAAAIAFAILAYQRSRLTTLLEPLVPLFDPGTARVEGWMRRRVAGRRRGRRVEIEASVHRGGRCALALECSTRGHLRVEPQWSGNRLASRLRLLQDAESGQPDLDARFVFSSNDPAAWFGYLLGGERRGATALTSAFDRGVAILEIGERRLTATMIGLPAHGSLPPAWLRTADTGVENVRALLHDLETVVEGAEAAPGLGTRSAVG